MSRFVPFAAGALLLAWLPSEAGADPAPTATPAPLQREFAAADTDRDGKLSPDEAKKGGFFSAASFADADHDHDGNVTLFELGKAVAASTKDLLDEHDRHDANDDGRVDRNEAKFGSRIYTVFDRADANQDSQVDRRELENYVAQSYYSENATYPITPNVIDEKF